MQYIYLFLGTLPILIICDLLWLGYVAKAFYVSRLSHLMGPVVWPGAILFYLLYTAGVLYFAVLPHTASGTTWVTAAMSGALLGLFAYGTYDLTNWATLKDWPLSVVILDIVWGMFLTSSVAATGYYLATKLLY